MFLSLNSTFFYLSMCLLSQKNRLCRLVTRIQSYTLKGQNYEERFGGGIALQHPTTQKQILAREKEILKHINAVEKVNSILMKLRKLAVRMLKFSTCISSKN